MHINLNRCNEELTDKEVLHLQHCQDCREDLNILNQLSESAKSTPLIVPQELNWQVIQRKMPVNKPKHLTKRTRSFLFQKISAIAASTFFIAVGWLVWNNYQLQAQLEQSLVQNQKLELQLEYGISLTFQQVHLLSELEQIEMALTQSIDAEDKVKLLKLRYEKLVTIIDKKELSNEISI